MIIAVAAIAVGGDRTRRRCTDPVLPLGRSAERRQRVEDVVEQTPVRAWRDVEELERDPVVLRSWSSIVARRPARP
jgi:DNA-directed RNA polymerase specialized sigma24 family protein